MTQVSQLLQKNLCTNCENQIFKKIMQISHHQLWNALEQLDFWEIVDLLQYFAFFLVLTPKDLIFTKNGNSIL